MKTISLLFLGLVTFLLPTVPGQAQDFEVSVRGARKSRITVGGDAKLASAPISNASLFTDFGLDPKKYAVICSGSTILLKPRSISAGLPTLTLFTVGNFFFSTQTTKPRSLLNYYAVTAPLAFTAGTPYQSFDGRFTLLTKAVLVGGIIRVTGVIGTATGATSTTTTPFLYNFTFSGTKVFLQKP